MNTKSLYEQLFNKNNLTERTIEVKDFQQPMLVAALETDELLRLTLQIFYNIGYQVHLIEFKKLLVRRKVATRKIIDKKIELLELIGAIKINDYYAKMTAQGISYFTDKYYKPNISILSKDKLSQLTRAKGAIATSQYRVNKAFQDVYYSTKFKYAVVTNDKDTKEKYINKVKKTIDHLKLDLYFVIDNKMKERNKQEVTVNIDIYIDKNVFNKYSSELLKVKENQIIRFRNTSEYMPDSIAHLNIRYRAFNN